MSKHTHGPWHYWKNQRTFGIYMAEGVPVAKVHGVGEIIEPRKEADARLIAAAPEMLAAIQCLLKDLGTGFDGMPSVGMCRAAVAKAIGEDQ